MYHMMADVLYAHLEITLVKWYNYLTICGGVEHGC